MSLLSRIDAEIRRVSLERYPNLREDQVKGITSISEEVIIEEMSAEHSRIVKQILNLQNRIYALESGMKNESIRVRPLAQG